MHVVDNRERDLITSAFSKLEVATADLSGFQIDFFMPMTGHDKTTSVTPCVAYLMKATAEGDGSSGTDTKASKQAPAMWEARTTHDVVTFNVAHLSQCSWIDMWS